MRRSLIASVAFVAFASVSVAGDYCYQSVDQCPPAQNEIEDCHRSCMRGYLLQATFCSALPPPYNALCHGDNSIDLANCMRDCRN